MFLLSGFFYDLAKQILVELIVSSIGKRRNRILSDQIKQKSCDLLIASNNQSTSKIEINIDSVTMLIREVYALAEKTPGMSVKNNEIVVKTRAINKKPSCFQELQLKRIINKRRKNITGIQLRENNDDDYQIISEKNSKIDTPLIFLEAEGDSKNQNQDVSLNEIANKYRTKIKEMIEDEEKDVY